MQLLYSDMLVRLTAIVFRPVTPATTESWRDTLALTPTSISLEH